jgi:hypothetical protein
MIPKNLTEWLIIDPMGLHALKWMENYLATNRQALRWSRCRTKSQ